ncbi:MAG: hypothetical protein WA738_16750 [Candidatus Angelobacter sp.]
MNTLLQHTSDSSKQAAAPIVGPNPIAPRSFALALTLALILIASMVACGGGASTQSSLVGPFPSPTPVSNPTPTPTPAPASLTVSPKAANVVLGGAQPFAATGQGTPVNWSVNGIPGGNSTFGTINASGVYTPPAVFPATNNFAVTATSQASPSVSASASVLVVYPNTNADVQTLPIKLGTSGGNVQDVSPTACCIGTLGSLVSRGGNLYVLSNNHVLARSTLGLPGEAINQPGAPACFANTNLVANLQLQSTIIPTLASNGIAPSNVDAALAQISAAAVDTAGTILELGPAGPSSIADAPPSATLATAAPGLSVAKSGRTTGLTCSTIGSISTSVSVDYDSFCGGPKAFTATFVGQVVVSGGNFSAPGDSGSLIVTTDNARPVALLFAGSANSTIANPIQDVLFEFSVPTRNPPIGASIVGGADHLVSCQPTATNPSSVQVGTLSQKVQALSAQERQRVTEVQQAHALLLMRDPAIASVTVGASEDSPGEGALVVHVSGAARAMVPAVIDGVRTRVVTDTPAAGTSLVSLTQKDVDQAMIVKEAYASNLMSQAGIQGVGVGISKDNAADSVVVIFVVRGIAHAPIPASLDGVRTQIVEGDRFRAY